MSPLSLAAAIACTAGGALAIGPITYRTIAVQGQAAPGQPAGVTFADLGDPRLTESGLTAYWAKMIGGPITAANDTAVFSNRSGTDAIILQKGQAVSTLDVTLAAIPTPVINNGAFAGFTGVVTTGAANFPTTLSILQELGPVLQEQARESDLARDFSLAQYTDAGQLVWRTGAGTEIFALEFDAYAHNIKLGYDAAGTGLPDAKFTRLFEPAVALVSRAGFSDPDIVFKADISYTGQTSPMTGLWAERGVTPPVQSMIARRGTVVTPIDPGVTFVDFGFDPKIDRTSRTHFYGTFEGAVLGSGVFGGLFREDAGTLALIARDNTPAPGLPGLTLAKINRVFVISDAGRVAFGGSLSGPGVNASNNAAVWVAGEDGSAPKLLAREGDAAPESLGAGVTYITLGRPMLSSTGRVVLTSHITGAGVNQNNNFVLLAGDSLDRLNVVARTGQNFTIPGTTTTKVIKDITFDQGPVQAGRVQFNGSGTLAYTLRFTDFTLGLFTAHVPSCPSDFNGDGFVTGDDFDEFVTFFIAGTLEADFNGDGFVTGDDFDAYLVAFIAGC